MTVIFRDWESHFDEKAGINLKKMALRAYLRVAPVIGLAVAANRDKPEWVPADSAAFMPLLAEMDALGQDPENVAAAYNAPFDIRVERFGRLEVGGRSLVWRDSYLERAHRRRGRRSEGNH